eukprot:gene20429-14017_t
MGAATTAASSKVCWACFIPKLNANTFARISTIIKKAESQIEKGTEGAGSNEADEGGVHAIATTHEDIVAQVADLTKVVEKIILEQTGPSVLTKETEQMSSEVERLNATVLALSFWFLHGSKPATLSICTAATPLQQKMTDLDMLVRDTAANLNIWTKEQAGYEFFNEWTIPILAAVLIAFLLMKETLYKWFSQEAAAVASKTMEDEQLLNTVRQTI